MVVCFRFIILKEMMLNDFKNEWMQFTEIVSISDQTIFSLNEINKIKHYINAEIQERK